MSDWQSLLTDLDNKTGMNDTRYLDALNHAQAWFNLQGWRLLIVEGPDAETFLQGQLTCDLAHSVKQKIVAGAHCNPKGRMLSSFDLIKMAENTFALRLHASIAESALAALKKYIVFSKASIRLEEQYQLIGFYSGAEGLHALEMMLPEPGNFSEAAGHYLLRHSAQQWELWVPTNAQAKPTVFEGMLPLPEDQWTLLNIRAGKAELRADTAEQFLPQELNFQLIGAVSFKKGCYTGQEIIARLHYKGQLKKHLYRVNFNHESEPAYLQDISLQGEDGNTKNVGSLACFAPSAANTFDALVLCQDSAHLSENVTLDGNKLQWAPLPYAIPG